MSLIDFTHGKLLKAINTANNIIFSMDDVVFSKPRVNAAGYIGGNTLLRMLPRNRAGLDGSTVFGYDRVNLSVIANAVGNSIAVPAAVTDPMDMLPYFHQNYGIGISAQDITANITLSGAVAQYSLSKLFNTGFKHSATTIVNTNAVPAEQSSWTYDAANDKLVQPTDTTQVSGIITPESFSDYALDVTLGGGADNGYIGVVLAAYWDAAAGKMETLSCDLTMVNGGLPNIQYCFGESLSQTMGGFADGVGTGKTWAQAGTRRVHVVRTGNTITVTMYGFSLLQDPAVVTGTKVIDLSSDAKYTNFRTSARVGVITKNNLQTEFSGWALSKPANVLTVTAGADNHYFLGSGDFVITDGPALVETPYTYDVAKHTRDSGKAFAETYRYPLNMTPQKTTMQTITASTIDFKALCTALTAVTGDAWQFAGKAPYSLENAIVRKVGASQAVWGVSTSYAYAVVIELSPSCTALEGNLLLHFT